MSSNTEAQPLPEHLQRAIDRVLAADPQFATKEGAKDCCVLASQLLIDEIKKEVRNADAKKVKIQGSYYHVWVRVDDEWNIDLTARQFDPTAPCPKIWREASL